MATLDGFYSSLSKPARPNGSALLSKVPVVGAASTAVKVVPVMGPDVANQAGRALQQQHQHHYQHQHHHQQHHQHQHHQAQQRPVAATSGVVNNGQETITTTTGTIGTTGTDGGIVMVPHIHSHPATGQTNPPSYRQVFPQYPQKQSQQQQTQQQHQHQHQHQQHAHPRPFPQPHHFPANTPTAGYAVGARDSDILRSSALCVGRPFRLRIANDSSAKVQYQIKATTRCGCSACAGWLKKTSLTLLGHSAKTFEINSSVQLTLKCRCAYNPTVKHKLVAQYRGDEVIGMCTAAATATTGTTTTTTAATIECADGDCPSTKAAPCVIMSVIHDAVYQAQLLGYAHGHGENVQRPIQMTYAQQLERREQEHRQVHHPDQRPSHQQTEEVSEKRPFSSNEPVVLVRGPDGKEFLTLESELPYLQLPLPPLPTTAAATATNGNPVGKGNAPPIFTQQPSGAEPVKEPYNIPHDTSFNASGISASNTLHQPPSQMYPISYGIEDRKMYCRGRPRQLVISSLEPIPFTAYSVCGCNVCQFWQEQSMVSHNGLSQSNSQSSPLLKSIGDAGRVDVSEQPLYSSTFNITSCVDVTFDFECQKVVGNRHRLIPPTIPDAPWNLGCKDGCYTMELIPQ